MRFWPVAALLLAACSPGAGDGATAAAPPAAPATHPESGLPIVPLAVSHDGKAHDFRVEVARTAEEQARGLMFRRAMGADEGMLFPFDPPRQASFWMKNTLIPLTAAFVADDGAIVNLADMKPLDESSHCSAKPVRYVLEMNQGWFEQRHLKAGAKLRGKPFDGKR